MKRLKPLSASILIVLGLLLSGASPSPKPSGKAESHQAIRQNHREVDQGYPPEMDYAAFESALTKALDAVEQRRESAEEKEDTKHESFWPLIPNNAIVYVTIGYILVGVFQLGAIWRQANIASRALTLTQRPYLRVALSTHYNDKNFHLVCVVANEGHTLARIIDSNWSIVVTDSKERPSCPAYHANNVGGRIQNVTIGSNRHDFITARQIFSQAEWDAFYSRDKFLHVFAYVDYRDSITRKILYHSEIGLLAEFQRIEYPTNSILSVNFTIPPNHTFREDT
jgi:hypothetical protein